MYNSYMPYNNQFYGQQNTNRYQPMDLPIQGQNFATSNLNRPGGLCGKQVDSLDVVKAMDITLDGSINYFPIVDGSAIATKQIQKDGTSKIVVYKPIDDEKLNIKYITQEDMEKAIKKIDLSDIKDDIKTIKKQIKELRDKDE